MFPGVFGAMGEGPKAKIEHRMNLMEAYALGGERWKCPECGLHVLVKAQGYFIPLEWGDKEPKEWIEPVRHYGDEGKKIDFTLTFLPMQVDWRPPGSEMLQ